MAFAWFTFFAGIVIGAVAGYFVAASRLEMRFIKGVTGLREEVAELKGELGSLRMTLLKSEEEREKLGHFNVLIPDVIRKLTSLDGRGDVPFVAVRSIKNFFDAGMVFYIAPHEEGEFVLSMGAGYDKGLNENVKIRSGEGIIGMAIEFRKTLSDEDFKELERHSRVTISEFEKNGLKAELVAPIVGTEGVYGAVALAEIEHHFPEEKRYLTMIGDVIALSLDKARLRAIPLKEEYRDRDIDVYTKEYFSHRFVLELQKAENYMLPLALVMFTFAELGNVKKAGGDKGVALLLKSVVAAVKERTRRSDFIVRYEEDIFAIVMISSTKDQARLHARRVSEEIASRTFTVPGVSEDISVSMVYGISGFHEDGSQTSDLISEAEKALSSAMSEKSPRQIGKGSET